MVEGRFTVSSGRMVGSYKERTFEYEVVQWIKRDEYTPHSQRVRKRISPEQLDEAETITVKITKPDGEEEYRYLYGPFFGRQAEVEQHLTDIMLYKSP
jgi:hypothetical protein